MAGAAGLPVRYVLVVERAERQGQDVTVVVRADLPDALGGDSWYVDLPRGGGTVRARIVLDLGNAADRAAGAEALLVSRWAPVPPEGPCAEESSWDVSVEHARWLEEQAAGARPIGRTASSPTGRFPAFPDAGTEET